MFSWLDHAQCVTQVEILSLPMIRSFVSNFNQQRLNKVSTQQRQRRTEAFVDEIRNETTHSMSDDAHRSAFAILFVRITDCDLFTFFGRRKVRKVESLHNVAKNKRRTHARRKKTRPKRVKRWMRCARASKTNQKMKRKKEKSNETHKREIYYCLCIAFDSMNRNRSIWRTERANGTSCVFWIRQMDSTFKVSRDLRHRHQIEFLFASSKTSKYLNFVKN